MSLKNVICWDRQLTVPIKKLVGVQRRGGRKKTHKQNKQTNKTQKATLLSISIKYFSCSHSDGMEIIFILIQLSFCCYQNNLINNAERSKEPMICF